MLVPWRDIVTTSLKSQSCRVIRQSLTHKHGAESVDRLRTKDYIRRVHYHHEPRGDSSLSSGHRHHGALHAGGEMEGLREDTEPW